VLAGRDELVKDEEVAEVLASKATEGREGRATDGDIEEGTVTEGGAPEDRVVRSREREGRLGWVRLENIVPLGVDAAPFPAVFEALDQVQ